MTVLLRTRSGCGWWAALLCAALSSGCALHGDRAERAVGLPSAWRHAQVLGDTGPVEAQWWRSFGSTELDALIARAQSQSNDLAAAVARVRQADARARIAGAALRPQVTGTLGASREGRLGGNATVAGSTYAAGFAASYELDLWGRDAALRDEALQGLRASAFDRDTVRLTVTADVAATWLLALALRERTEIAARNLDNARRVLALVESRSRAGAVSPLDLAQQRGLVAAQQRALAALHQQAGDAETALALLLGTAAPAFELRGPRLDALQVPVIGAGAGAPSALLVRRPDIARAEAHLAAADANVLAARAALLPTVSLSATVGTGESRFGRLFDNPLYSLAAGLTAPVFDGGRLAGGQRLAEAKREELLAAYRGAIVGAFADAETALNGVSAIDAQATAQGAELAEARRAAELSEARYRAGAETLLTLLDAQRTLYAAQDLAVQLRMARLQARVSLYRAMGGGWQQARCTSAAAAEGHTECV
ncbi:efflux transporter outer membrane subunit [Variovorax paradoxus]|uniref:efflux transporter outer membrane subunit n=1 Tax=Variovorax paradoxus TaxID=34073 RepID=UPI00215F414E|nr:efflux transporter outer membrane subunit [Variovorax paradoxus]UVH59443.1 efflux transporter outer membrane subunit [Variovorax paradoxus]